MGRWLVMLGAGLVGVLYFMAGLVPLVNGSVDFSSTEVTIHDIEKNGFPDAVYLHVTGGAVVWSLAEVDGDRILAPLASPELISTWKPGEPAPASQLRLAVRFRAEQLEERWPGLLERAGNPALPAMAAPVTGETVAFRHLVGNALPGLTGMDKEAMRAMYFERHRLGSCIRKLLWGCLLLILCAAMVVWHWRQPPPSVSTGPEVEVAAAGGMEMLDDD